MEPSPVSRVKEALQIAQQSEELIVGDESCTFITICNVVTSSKSAGIIWNKLIDLARALEIPPEDVQKIKFEVNWKTYTTLFYDILESWRGKKSGKARLTTLLKVLENIGVKDCADVLRKHFGVRYYPCSEFGDIKKRNTWEDLSSRLKLKILEKEVFFQGKKIELVEAVGNYDISSIDGRLLVELATDITPTLVNNQLPDELNYYIERSIKSRSRLKAEIFQKLNGDIVLIQGINKIHLTELSEEKDTDVSGNQISQRRLTAQLILLECDGDFERICKLTSQPVHWIKFQEDSYEWVKSSGSVESLQHYLHENQESFNETEMRSKNSGVVVISDTPGMGKTMLLANIARTILKQNPTALVRFIVLKELVEDLSCRVVDVDTIISQIASKSSEIHLGRKLVEHTLRTTECYLMFNGFDEVLSNQIDTAKKILQVVVKNLKMANIYVTTRPHMREELENTLQVLGYTIHPFQKADQINFLSKFWESTELPESSQFAELILSSLNSNMTDFERDIAGIPLQCRLLAETYDEEAKRCFELGYQAYLQNLETSNIVSSIFGMYEKHMNTQFEKIRTNKSLFCLPGKQQKKKQINSIKRAHMRFALELLFPEHSAQFKSVLFSGTSVSINDLCGHGILEATNSNDIRFVHRTFAEYLIAWFAVKQGKNGTIREFLLSQVFGTKTTVEHLTVPTYDFISGSELSKKDTVEIKSYHFNFPVICYFINGFIKNQKQDEYQPSNLSVKLDLEMFQHYPRIFFAAAFHNYLYGLTFALQLLADSKGKEKRKRINDFQTTLIDSCELLLITAKYADIEMMKGFCPHININEIKLNHSSITPFHVAVQRGQYFLVNYLEKQYDSQLANLKYVLHFCVSGSIHNSTKIINDKKEIIKKLLNKKTKWWLNERSFNNSEPPLLQDKVNAELVEFLIQEGAEINKLDKNGNTVIHKITKNPVTPDIFHRIVVALSERGFEHFNTALDSWMRTPLQCAIKSVELSKETLELFDSKGVDFNHVDWVGNSILFDAITCGRSVEIIDHLIHFGANWELFNEKKDGVLHVCAKSGRYDALKYFIENHGSNVNSLNAFLQTPLHVAVLNRTQKHEEIQRHLISLGANMDAFNEDGLIPFQRAFINGAGLSLNIIRLMEENGLSITKEIAYKAQQSALANRQMKLDGDLKKVLQYLMQKVDSYQPRVPWNPWKFEKIRQSMDEIIQNTDVLPELLINLKHVGFLTAAEIIQLEKKETAGKSSCLYEILQGKTGSYELVCLTLLSNDQTKAFEILRNNLYEAQQFKTFTTLPPGVTHLLGSNEINMMLLVTKNVDITIQRIKDTTGEILNVIEEHDISFQSHVTMKGKLTVVKCRDFTRNLLKTFQDLIVNGKILILCTTCPQEIQKLEVKSSKDDYSWEDLSIRFLRRLKCTVYCNQLRFNDLFASAEVTKKLDLYKPLLVYDFRMIDFKIGHGTKNNDIYLSKSIFHFFLVDKLVFVGISQDELTKYTNVGHRIGCVGAKVEHQDYIVCNQHHEFEDICKETTANVHLIEHYDGKFRLVKTFGFDSEIKSFYEQSEPTLCNNFPDCDCDNEVHELMVNFTFHDCTDENNTIRMFFCKLNDLLPKMQHLLKLKDYTDCFDLMKNCNELVEKHKTSALAAGMDSNAKGINQSYLNKVDDLFTHLKITEIEYLKLKQIATNYFFPNFQKSVDLSGLEKYVKVGVLLNNNDTLNFSHELMAWYLIAKMAMTNELDETLINNIMRDCFDPHIFSECYSSFNKYDEKKVVSTRSELIESFVYSSATFFNFLEFFLSKGLTLKNSPKFQISQKIAEKLAQCCVFDNQYNLLKLILSMETGTNLFAFRNRVLLAVKCASEQMIDLVVKQYTRITNKDVNEIKLYLTNDTEISILHFLRGNFAVVDYLLCNFGFKDVLNQPSMNDLIHFCVVDTSTSHGEEVKERMLIIDLLLQHNPNLINERDNRNYTPLLVPNIHVNLAIHLLNLGLDVNATDEYSSNFMHLCPIYMTSQHYQVLVHYICTKGKSKIFHSINKDEETPLHSAVKHLEIMDSTLKLMESFKVDFNAKDEHGNTVLYHAVIHGGSAKFLDALICAGAVIDQRTIVHAAAEYGNFSAMRYFLAQRCDINATDKFNDTPLHHVLNRHPSNNYEIVKILIEHGANVNPIGNDRKSPLSIALEKKEKGDIASGTVELIKKAGGLESNLKKIQSPMIVIGRLE